MQEPQIPSVLRRVEELYDDAAALRKRAQELGSEYNPDGTEALSAVQNLCLSRAAKLVERADELASTLNT